MNVRCKFIETKACIFIDNSLLNAAKLFNISMEAHKHSFFGHAYISFKRLRIVHGANIMGGLLRR
jgi:hypothetical protein